MKRVPTLALALSLLVCAGCSDDDPIVPDDGFDVTFRVVDTAGGPVPGLSVGLASDNDYMQDALTRPSVRVAFQIPEAAHVLITIEDVDGVHRRTLSDADVAQAGNYQLTWEGSDDGGVPQPSGRYLVRMVGSVDGTVAFEDTAVMLMAIIDAGRYSVGTTDDAGEVVLTERRLFPHLYGLEPFPAYDEGGSTMGQIELDAVMYISLYDPLQDARMAFREEVDGDGAFVEMIWNPTRAGAPAPIAPELLAADGPVALPEYEWRLYDPYPNPFN